MQNAQEQQHVAQMQEIEEASEFLKQALSVSRSVSSLTGTIATGSVAVATEGQRLNGLSTLNVTARNRPASPSAITFKLEQVLEPQPGVLDVREITTFTVTPGNRIIGTFGLPQPNTKSTFRVVASAAPANPPGVDNYTLNVSGS